MILMYSPVMARPSVRRYAVGDSTFSQVDSTPSLSSTFPKLIEVEEILTSDSPSSVEEEQDFFELCEAFGAFGVGRFTDVPCVWMSVSACRKHLYLRGSKLNSQFAAD